MMGVRERSSVLPEEQRPMRDRLRRAALRVRTAESERLSAMRDARTAGWSLREIALEVGLSAAGVRKILARPERDES